MKLEAPKNQNYCATVVKISKIIDLPKLDRTKGAIVSGYQVIVSKDQKEGDIGIFFPVECKLSEEFCHVNNLNTDPLLNKDQTKKGYVSKRRLKCQRFQGNKSEGLLLPMSCLSAFASDYEITNLKVGDEFDHINGKLICEKYEVQTAIGSLGGNHVTQHKKGEKKIQRVIETQFRFHESTNQLKKNMHKVNPDDIISISSKWHGTSAICGNVLVNKQLTWKDKIAKLFGVKVVDKEYGMIYSSRSILKNKYFATNKTYEKELEASGCVWYNSAKRIFPSLPNGVTVYYEIVGYTQNGKAIQKGYTYKAEPNIFMSKVYRITQVNDKGNFIEYSWGQIKDFCNKYGLEHCPEFYYGKAKDMFPEIPVDEKWHDNVLDKLQQVYLEKDCEYNPGMPAEGIVLKIDNLQELKVFKLKSYRFLEKEAIGLDNGEVDMESAETVAVES